MAVGIPGSRDTIIAASALPLQWRERHRRTFTHSGAPMAARALTAALTSILVTGIAAAAAPVDRDFGATVLCYHIVESPQDPRMEVSRETFRQQMRYLA